MTEKKDGSKNQNAPFGGSVKELRNMYLIEELLHFLVNLVGSLMLLECTAYPYKNAPFYCLQHTYSSYSLLLW